MLRFIIVLMLALPPISASTMDLSSFRIVDLSHTYNDETLFWPTSPTRFKKQKLSFGVTPAGYFYSAFSFCTPEHGGTHLDAPLHFSEKGLPADQIPLNNLVAQGVVIDVTAQAAEDRNYRLTVDDLLAHEEAHGRIPAGSIVLLNTGWSKFWPDAKAYLGDDTWGDASKLSFPSYGTDATRVLVEERGVSLLGVDTASIDYGPSKDFMVHRIAAAGQVGGLENLTGLDALPAKDFLVVALPVKVGGGSGAPVRVVALLPN